MKIKNRIRNAQSCLLAAALAAALALSAQAAPPALNGRVISRPLTPGDVTRYNLPATLENSGGLYTFAIGTPTYLEADVNIAIPAANITSVTWSLSAKPLTSAAVITNSPLGTNVLTYLPSDQLVYRVASYALLRPDVVGTYTVKATIVTTTGGTTNATATFNVGTYLGVETCALCHSGNSFGTPDVYPSWSTTEHATMFTRGIDGVLGSYSVSCIKCHTTGYDTNASALGDGGFYAVQQEVGWTFPTVLTNTNWAAVPNGYPSLQAVANITCENCHGPGSQHANLFGNTNAPNWPALDINYNAGTCNQCHDAPTHHIYGTEWLASAHSGGLSTAATIPSGAGRDACVQCHTAYGYITAVSNSLSTNTVFAPTNTTYAAIDCQTCHEPHGMTAPTNDSHLLRIMTQATLGDGTVITNAGEGNLCLTCHHSRNGSAITNVINFAAGLPTWYGGTSSFGPHDGPQGDMIEGTNAIMYGLSIPSSAHRISVTNACVGCHMQTLASTDPGLYLSGGHSFEMSYNTFTTNGSVVTTNKIDQVGVCNQCHGGITTFNFPVEDYAGVGQVLGVQDEVQILLNQLSTLLPNSSGVFDGLVKTSVSPTTNHVWTTNLLAAAYNWQFVVNDGSLGVHNAPYATGILKASIASLTTGVNSVDGLPDSWETQYFGSVTNVLGDPNADPAGDGVPNWLKYALGLNPLVAAKPFPSGVVYADATILGGGTNTVQIYNAAEVNFQTQVGWTYQIQAVSSLSGGWENVGEPLQGTGESMSYLTPTRSNVQQFYRVVSTPP